MQSYKQKQEKLFNELESSFKQGKSASTIVSVIDDFSQDQRLCLTGVCFLPQALQDSIQELVVTPLRQADSRQYFYLPQSLHLTIKNVRASAHPPTFGKREIGQAAKAFRKVISKHKRFEFELKGLFELPTSLAIRAYSGSELKGLVLDLTEALESVGVPDDKKYASQQVFFGNTTIARYNTKPSDNFFRQVTELKSKTVGTFTLDKISLITTNTVAHPEQTEVIQEFSLRA